MSLSNYTRATDENYGGETQAVVGWLASFKPALLSG